MRLRKVDYASFFKSTTPVLNEAVGIILQISNLENSGLSLNRRFLSWSLLLMCQSALGVFRGCRGYSNLVNGVSKGVFAQPMKNTETVYNY